MKDYKDLRKRFKDKIVWMKNIHHDEYDDLIEWFNEITKPDMCSCVRCTGIDIDGYYLGD